MEESRGGRGGKVETAETSNVRYDYVYYRHRNDHLFVQTLSRSSNILVEYANEEGGSAFPKNLKEDCEIIESKVSEAQEDIR